MSTSLEWTSAPVLRELAKVTGLFPVIGLAVAVFTVVLSVGAVQELLATQGEKKAVQQVPTFKINQVQLSPKAYENYAVVLQRLNPTVRVTAEKDKLLIEAQQAELFAEFMYVLNSIQGLSPRVVWRADEICLAGCSNAASRATVRGFEEKVNVTLGGSK